MIFTSRWFLSMAAGLAVVPLLYAFPGLWVVPIAWWSLIAAATVADFVLIPAGASLGVTRSMDERVGVGATGQVSLALTNTTTLGWRLLVHEEPPPGVECDWHDVAVDLAPASRTLLQYGYKASRRGEQLFGEVWYRVHGRLGLVGLNRRACPPATVTVIPDIDEAGRLLALFRRGRLTNNGLRLVAKGGGGREFESLREYVPDDEYRRIDWKATARRGKLIARQYQAERSQSILLVLDVGRTMMAEVDGMAKLDYAINAALALAAVSLHADDRVGLLVFADEVRTWIAPDRGQRQLARILRALEAVRATRTEPDYAVACAYLATHWRRRSMAVVFTDLWDPDSSHQMIREISALQPSHLVTAVTCMDSNAMRRAAAPVGDAQDAYEKAVAIQLQDDRGLAVAELRKRGAIVVDSPAHELSADLVSRYVDVKQRMLL